MGNDTRRLAAIMFTDMVGYSRQTNRNESLSLQLLREHQALIRATLERFRGREIDTAGDGFVVEFPSTEDSLDCAIAIQKGFAERNQNRDESERVYIRIGIHVSDVVEFADENKKGIYGNGVNIAARLQPLAPIGGICISRAVFEQLQREFDCRIRPMGEHKLKGMRRAMRLYSVQLNDDSPLTFKQKAADAFRFVNRRFSKYAVTLAVLAALAMSAYKLFNSAHSSVQSARIAVLPFEGIGFSADQSYLTEGFTDGLISLLSQRGLRVLAHDTVKELRRSHKTPREIGSELNVTQVLTGTLTAPNGAAHLVVSLIDTKTEEVLWSRSLKKPTLDIFALQTELARDIETANSKLYAAATGLTASRAPKPEAYLAYLKGQFFMKKRTHADYDRAAAQYEEAIRLDPDFAQPYAALSGLADLQLYYGISSPFSSALKMIKNAQRALDLDPHSTESLLAQAEVKYYVEFDRPAADELYLRAISANPQNATAHQWYCEFLAIQKRFSDARKECDIAITMDPLGAAANVTKWVIRIYAGQTDEAIGGLKKLTQLDPSFALSQYWLGRAYLTKNDFGDAVTTFERANQLSPNEPMILTALAAAYGKAGRTKDAQRTLASLSAAGSENYVSPYLLAAIRLHLGDKTEAFALLKHSVRDYSGQTATLEVDPYWNSIRGEAEFHELEVSLRPRSL